MSRTASIGFIVCLVTTTLAGGAHGQETVRQVSQHGITWTFDEPVRAGQFVNGDWWVVPADGASAVTVVEVDPAPTTGPDGGEDSRRHGSMVNPQPGGDQGYDSRARGYEPAVSVTFPLELRANRSLVSTRSRGEDETFNPPGMGLYGNDRSRGYPADAAVLTCLREAPPEDAFRPPYSGDHKPVLLASAMDLSRLPSLDAVGDTPSLEHYERGLSRVWIDHKTGWTGQFIRPNNHMPSYGRDIARHIGDAALLLCLGDIGDRTTLAHGMIQMGIDFYGIIDAGGGWPADGGHGHGRKFPIVLAGYLMYDADGDGSANDHAHAMLHVGELPRYRDGGTARFQEDENFFFVTEEDLGRELDVTRTRGLAESVGERTLGVTHPAEWTTLVGNVVEITEGPGASQRRLIVETDIGRRGGSGTVTLDEAWDEMPVADQSRYQVLGYREEHLGLAEWGVRHAQTPRRDNPSWNAEYRSLVGRSTVGFTLAARLIGLEEPWNHEPLFAYVDRYVERDGTIQSDFAANMWAAYREHEGD